MRKLIPYLLLLALSIMAVCFAATGSRMTGGAMTLSLPHFIPAVAVTFPLGTVGITFWLFDPLDRFRSILACVSLLLSPLVQIHFWNFFLHQQRRKSVEQQA